MNLGLILGIAAACCFVISIFLFVVACLNKANGDCEKASIDAYYGDDVSIPLNDPFIKDLVAEIGPVQIIPERTAYRSLRDVIYEDYEDAMAQNACAKRIAKLLLAASFILAAMGAFAL